VHSRLIKESNCRSYLTTRAATFFKKLRINSDMALWSALDHNMLDGTGQLVVLVGHTTH
jgi:hypothetical protein